MSHRAVIFIVMMLALTGYANAFTTSLGNATVIISYLTPVNLQNTHGTNGQCDISAMWFGLTINQPDIYLAVFEADPSKVPGGINRLTSEFNDRYNISRNSEWFDTATAMKYLFFGHEDLSKSAIAMKNIQ